LLVIAILLLRLRLMLQLFYGELKLSLLATKLGMKMDLYSFANADNQTSKFQ